MSFRSLLLPELFGPTTTVKDLGEDSVPSLRRMRSSLYLNTLSPWFFCYPLRRSCSSISFMRSDAPLRKLTTLLLSILVHEDSTLSLSFFCSARFYCKQAILLVGAVGLKPTLYGFKVRGGCLSPSAASCRKVPYLQAFRELDR